MPISDGDIVFEQQLPNNFVTQHAHDGGSLHGGINFVPFRIPRSVGVHEDVRVYVKFPRTTWETMRKGLGQPLPT
jgi:hypothetical protein